MAKSYPKPHRFTPILLFICLILSIPSSSSARLLNNMPLNLAADEPAMNLVLLGENVVVAYPLEKESQHVLPCDHMEPRKSKVGFPAAPRLAGKYGPVFLNMLPKGPVPPSGPSKGTNNMNN